MIQTHVHPKLLIQKEMIIFTADPIYLEIEFIHLSHRNKLSADMLLHSDWLIFNVIVELDGLVYVYKLPKLSQYNKCKKNKRICLSFNEMINNDILKVDNIIKCMIKLVSWSETYSFCFQFNRYRYHIIWLSLNLLL